MTIKEKYEKWKHLEGKCVTIHSKPPLARPFSETGMVSFVTDHSAFSLDGDHLGKIYCTLRYTESMELAIPASTPDEIKDIMEPKETIPPQDPTTADMLKIAEANIGKRVRLTSSWTEDVFEGNLLEFNKDYVCIGMSPDGFPTSFPWPNICKVEPVGDVPKITPEFPDVIGATKQNTLTEDAFESLLRDYFADTRTAKGIIKNCLKTMQERGDQRDSPEGERSMEKVVGLFNLWSGKDVTVFEGWMFMVFLKMVRSRQGEPDADNFVDGSSYMALAGEEAMKV